MGKMVRLAVLLGISLLAACASIPQGALSTPRHIVAYHELRAESDEAKAADGAFQVALREEAIVRGQFEESMISCRSFLATREERSNSRRRWPAILLIGGIVAGSVIVPSLAASNAAANAGWIAGVGGLSGGAIATSKVLESSGLSGAADAREHNDLVKSVREQVAITLDPTIGFEERMRAALRIKAECMTQPIHVPVMPNG